MGTGFYICGDRFPHVQRIQRRARSLLLHEDIEYKESLEYIFDKHDIDVVFNLATKALNYSFVNPGNAFTTNVTGVINLLELQRKGKFKSLCHFSTSEVPPPSFLLHVTLSPLISTDAGATFRTLLRFCPKLLN